jgi:hypothetical protein
MTMPMHAVGTQIEQEPEAHVQNSRNWILWFGKPEVQFCLVLWQLRAPTARDESASPPAKQHLDDGWAGTTAT